MLKQAGLVIVALVLLGQVVRPNRANPPVDPSKTLAASSHVPPAVAASLNRACRDCHSSETAWPWYTNITPVSWWVAHHVSEGRREVSFSTWKDLEPRRQFKKLGDICEQVAKKDMPMPSYLLMHRDAGLSESERQAICDWTKAEQAALGPLPPGPAGEREGRRRRRD